MARKNKPTKSGAESSEVKEQKIEESQEVIAEQASAKEADATEVKEQKIEKKVAEISEKPAEASPSSESKKIKLQDASKRFVVGYKEHWFKSIEKFAKSQGYTDPGTPDECKDILKRWGAKVI